MSNPEIRDYSLVVEDSYYGRIAPDLDDVIFRYREPHHDHIRYHTQATVQTEQGNMPVYIIRCLFVGSSVLDLLARHGVPETYVDLPTQAVVNAFDADQIQRYDKELGEEPNE